VTRVARCTAGTSRPSRRLGATPQDIKDQYASASICGNNRVVFNVGGNKYRLVVEMQYRAGIVWVKFVGNPCAVRPHRRGERQ
jgi:mRNA-degrading endonuclease HigB of HigAB toxin-antitoxin module